MACYRSTATKSLIICQRNILHSNFSLLYVILRSVKQGKKIIEEEKQAKGKFKFKIGLVRRRRDNILFIGLLLYIHVLIL